MRMFGTGLVSLAGIVLALAVQFFDINAALAESSPAQIASYRQAVMKSMSQHMKAIDMILKGEVGFLHHVGDHAVAITGMSRGLIEVFPKGSDAAAAETRALPAIWAKPKEFQDRALAMNQAAARLVNAAMSGDRDAMANQAKALGQACGDCHKTFRKEQP